MVEGDSSEGEAGVGDAQQPPPDQEKHSEREAAGTVKPPGPPAAMASFVVPSGAAAGEGGLVIGAEAAAEQQSAAAAAAAVEQPAAGKDNDDDGNNVSLSARQAQQGLPKLFGEEDAPFADGVQQGQTDVESEIGGPLSPMTTSSIRDDCSTGSDFDWEGASPTEPSSPTLRGVHRIAVEVMRRSFGSAEGDPGMCNSTACVCASAISGVIMACDEVVTCMERPQMHQFRPFFFGTLSLLKPARGPQRTTAERTRNFGKIDFLTRTYFANGMMGLLLREYYNFLVGLDCLLKCHASASSIQWRHSGILNSVRHVGPSFLWVACAQQSTHPSMSGQVISRAASVAAGRGKNLSVDFRPGDKQPLERTAVFTSKATWVPQSAFLNRAYSVN